MSREDKKFFHNTEKEPVSNKISGQIKVVIFGKRLSLLTFMEGDSVEVQGLFFNVNDSKVYSNGKELTRGKNTIENKTVFVLEEESDISVSYISPPNQDFIISKEKEADLLIHSKAYVLFSNGKVYLYPNGCVFYLNEQLISYDIISEFKKGDSIFVENYFIEFLENQWQISSFFEKANFNSQSVLLEEKKSIYQSNFPVYRRSPRVLPTIYDKRQRIEKPKNPPTKPKNAIWRAIVPPLGMVALSGLVVVLMGRNAIMMLSMGGMSVLTAAFSITSYFTDKKAYKQKKITRVEDYEAC